MKFNVDEATIGLSQTSFVDGFLFHRIFVLWLAAPGTAQIAHVFNAVLRFQIAFFVLLTCKYLLAYTATHDHRR